MTTNVIYQNTVVRGTLDATQGLLSRGVPVEALGGAGGGGDAYEGIPATKGDVYHVDSGHANASDSNTGKTKDRPLATIDAAVAKCTANNGDVILVSEGHSETITAAGGIDLDVAGISVIGLGQGESRPTITFGTNTTASLKVSAANVTIRNLLFKCDVDSQAIMIDVNAKDCEISGCAFREGTLKQALTVIDVNGGSANACDRARILGNEIVMTTAGPNQAIELGEVADGVVISGNWIDGDWSNAGIHNPTGKVLTNLLISGNVVRNRQTGDHAIELVSACTGECVGNFLFGDTAAAILDPGSLLCAGNMAQAAADKPGFTVPLSVEDQTTNVLGADNADNAFSSSNVVANEDGSVLERLEQIQEAVNRGSGTALAANTSIRDLILGTASAGTNAFLGTHVSRAAADIIDGTTTSVFTVSGGRVLITGLFGVISGAAVDATLSNCKFQANPTTGTTTDMCANLDVQSDEVGTMYSVDGDPTAALVRGKSGSVPGMSVKGVVVNAGTIDFVSSADAGTGGALLALDLWYLPINDGASVAAA